MLSSSSRDMSGRRMARRIGEASESGFLATHACTARKISISEAQKASHEMMFFIAD